MESEIYSTIYAHVFAKLEEFDIFEIVFKFFIAQLLKFIQWLSNRLMYFYKYMNDKQLDTLEAFYNGCIKNVQVAKERFIIKKEIHMSRLLNNPLTEHSRRGAGEPMETMTDGEMSESISVKSVDKTGKKTTKRLFSSNFVDEPGINSGDKLQKQKDRKKKLEQQVIKEKYKHLGVVDAIQCRTDSEDINSSDSSDSDSPIKKVTIFFYLLG